MGERLSPFQERKLAEAEWLEVGGLENSLNELQEKIDREYGGDIFSLTNEELGAAQKTASNYLERAKGKRPNLDRLAEQIIKLPPAETATEELEKDVDEAV